MAGARFRAGPAAPGLHVVATPIGHLGDVGLRALETLAGVDALACEDTRVTAKLLARYDIRVPLLAYHEHNAAEMRPRLLARLAAGEALALVSDAGTPLVSDPGYKLVAAAIAAGHAVVAVPGPSAMLAALVVAGLPSDRFFFEGFLPPKAAGRRARLGELAAIPATLILYETGPRLAQSLADMAATLGERPAAVCRELTKLHEEVARGALTELAARFAGTEPKGEIVVVVGPPAETTASEADLDAALMRALAQASVKAAAADVAQALRLPKRVVYQRALALSGKGDDGQG